MSQDLRRDSENPAIKSKNLSRLGRSATGQEKSLSWLKRVAAEDDIKTIEPLSSDKKVCTTYLNGVNRLLLQRTYNEIFLVQADIEQLTFTSEKLKNNSTRSDSLKAQATAKKLQLGRLKKVVTLTERQGKIALDRTYIENYVIKYPSERVITASCSDSDEIPITRYSERDLVKADDDQSSGYQDEVLSDVSETSDPVCESACPQKDLSHCSQEFTSLLKPDREEEFSSVRSNDLVDWEKSEEESKKSYVHEFQSLITPFTCFVVQFTEEPIKELWGNLRDCREVQSLPTGFASNATTNLLTVSRVRKGGETRAKYPTTDDATLWETKERPLNRSLEGLLELYKVCIKRRYTDRDCRVVISNILKYTRRQLNQSGEVVFHVPRTPSSKHLLPGPTGVAYLPAPERLGGFPDQLTPVHNTADDTIVSDINDTTVAILPSTPKKLVTSTPFKLVKKATSQILTLKVSPTVVQNVTIEYYKKVPKLELWANAYINPNENAIINAHIHDGPDLVDRDSTYAVFDARLCGLSDKLQAGKLYEALGARTRQLKTDPNKEGISIWAELQAATSKREWRYPLWPDLADLDKTLEEEHHPEDLSALLPTDQELQESYYKLLEQPEDLKESDQHQEDLDIFEPSEVQLGSNNLTPFKLESELDKLAELPGEIIIANSFQEFEDKMTENEFTDAALTRSLFWLPTRTGEINVSVIFPSFIDMHPSVNEQEFLKKMMETTLQHRYTAVDFRRTRGLVRASITRNCNKLLNLIEEDDVNVNEIFYFTQKAFREIMHEMALTTAYRYFHFTTDEEVTADKEDRLDFLRKWVQTIFHAQTILESQQCKKVEFGKTLALYPSATKHQYLKRAILLWDDFDYTNKQEPINRATLSAALNDIKPTVTYTEGNPNVFSSDEADKQKENPNVTTGETDGAAGGQSNEHLRILINMQEQQARQADERLVQTLETFQRMNVDQGEVQLIGKFRGDATKWYPWWSEFEALVDKSSRFSVLTKFKKLKDSLEGPALTLINNLVYEPDNYQVAKDELHRTYGNAKLTAFKLMEAVMAHPPVQKGNLKSYRSFANEMKNALNFINKYAPTELKHNSYAFGTLKKKIPWEDQMKFHYKWSDILEKRQIGDPDAETIKIETFINWFEKIVLIQEENERDNIGYQDMVSAVTGARSRNYPKGPNQIPKNTGGKKGQNEHQTFYTNTNQKSYDKAPPKGKGGFGKKNFGSQNKPKSDQSPSQRKPFHRKDEGRGTNQQGDRYPKAKFDSSNTGKRQPFKKKLSEKPKKIECWICTGDHYANVCNAQKSNNPPYTDMELFTIMKKEEICHNCYKSGHMAWKCPKKSQCTVTNCGLKHTTNLHSVFQDINQANKK